MEIKCKVSIILPEKIVKAFDITDETPIAAYIADGCITVEISDSEKSDTLYEGDEDDNFCSEDCDNCEYYCDRCGNCVLD